MTLGMKYRSVDKMSDLISNDYKLLLVMSRFGLSLGFGDKTVKEVCEEQGVDTSTFLAVANFMQEETDIMGEEQHGLSVASLMDYLQQAHSYFLDFQLPTIRHKLVEAIDCSSSNEIAFLILKFFDEYEGEVRKHMEYEDQNVFTYVRAMLSGAPTKEGFTINVFARKHNQIEAKLTELKNIIIKYYPEKGNNHLLNAVLFDIFSCEQDLSSHCRVEDLLFVPAVRHLEKERNGK